MATAFASLGGAVSKLITHPNLAKFNVPLADLATCNDQDAVQSLCMGFLKAVAGDAAAAEYLNASTSSKYKEVGQYYVNGIAQIKTEIEAQAAKDPSLEATMKAAADGDAGGSIKGAEAFWKIFFPKGVGMMDNQEKEKADLKVRRKISNIVLNANPITEPIKEILFTSNVLLGMPADTTPIASLPYTDDFKTKLTAASKEKQVAWFDHPIQIGVDQPGNEILYGLIGLDAAVAWEKEKKKIPEDAKMLTALSITCTHTGLQNIAKQYVEEEFKAMPEDKKLKHLTILLFSEIETNALCDNVLKPALAKIGVTDVEPVRLIFGVEGQYGRHYSFLKAILAVYNTFVDEKVKGTFKIDIDQLFIQDSLMAETGESMLDHFKTPIWGATGKNWRGEDTEMGMIAGALCNEKDWRKSGEKLFCADVLPPPADKKLAADELIFFSGLPQAISTEAEMMTKYTTNDDLIQRIHVTGGTNGILVDSLFKVRPFSPSWIGRAEDQSYLFSTFAKDGVKLAYAHKPGLIMRHDKEAFAMEAMEAARIGKMVGDYERILLFSEYSQVCSKDFAATKELVDPFTGCFCVPIPYTTTYLRFAMKALGFIADGKPADAVDFTLMGAPRVASVVDFVSRASGKSKLATTHEGEVKAWDQFYDALTAAKGDASIADACKAIIAGATANL